MQNLENAHIFVDGTFDIAPKLFAQVYTVHALIDGRCFPMAYGLLSRKTEEIYVEFLNAVQNRLKHDPLSITSDFEKAFVNASMKVFPKVNVFGCFFHFKQSTWRKITDLGLKVIYLKDENVRHLLKLPQAIVFIPPEDVLTGFNLIKSKVVDLKILEFYNYVEVNYIGKLVLEKVG